MQYEQLNDILPNGLHDACVHKIRIDVNIKVIVLDLNLWVGGQELKNMEDREKRIKATIKILYRSIVIKNDCALEALIDHEMDMGIADDALRIKYDVKESHYLYFHGANDLIFVSPENIELHIS